MARYETSFLVPRSPEATFAFISDFRNALKWDPRTYAVEKVTDGPIGFGTTFLLTGGMIPKSGIVTRRLPKALLGGMPLPYKVTWYDPPREFVLEGESPIFSYEDRITFAGEGSGTRVTYSARLDFKGILSVGELPLRLVFKRIGDDATRDIPAVVERETVKSAA
jgi:carbon monoxide dehydrogenase subunit G